MNASGRRVDCLPVMELARIVRGERSRCWCDPQLVALDNLIGAVSDVLREDGLTNFADTFEIRAAYGEGRNPTVQPTKQQGD